MKRKFKHYQKLKVWIQIWYDKDGKWDVGILGKEDKCYYIGQRLPEDELHNFKFSR